MIRILNVFIFKQTLADRYRYILKRMLLTDRYVKKERKKEREKDECIRTYIHTFVREISTDNDR